MSWDMVNPYCITNGKYYIAKTGADEGRRYSTFGLNDSKPQGIYKTVEEAKAAVGDP